MRKDTRGEYSQNTPKCSSSPAADEDSKIKTAAQPLSPTQLRRKLYFPCVLLPIRRLSGASLSGGRGTIAGTFMGLLVVSVLNSGLTWIGVETFGQQVSPGLVILAAVLFDKVKGRV